jgi:drug/metabolite transporter (DMT)-like permease
VWSLYALGQKSLVAFHPPQSLNIFIFLLSTIIYAPFASYSSMMNYSLFTWFVLLLCGLNTFIAYGAVAEAIKCMPAAIVSVIISLNPLLTMIIMKFINQSEILGTNNDLREALGSTGLWGASLLIAGAVLIIAGPKIKTEALRFRFTK